MNEPHWEQLEDDWEDHLIEYSMDVMHPADAEEFRRQLSECHVHVKLADQYMQVVGWLGTAAASVEPPAGHKSRLMSRIASTTQEQATATAAGGPLSAALPPVTPITFMPQLHPEAAAPPQVENAETLPYNVTSLGEARRRKGLSRNVALLSSVAAAVVILLGAAWLYSLLSKPYIPAGWNTLALQPRNGALQNSAVVLLMNNDRNDAVLVAGNLDPLPTGEVYELWFMPQTGVANPAPVAAVAFVPNAGGAAKENVKAPSNLSAYSAVAVTVEHSFVNAPTTKPVLVGQNTAP